MQDNPSDTVTQNSLKEECLRIKPHMELHSLTNKPEYEDYNKLCITINRSPSDKRSPFDFRLIQTYKSELAEFTEIAQQYNDRVAAAAATKRGRPPPAGAVAAAPRETKVTVRPKFLPSLEQSSDLELFSRLLHTQPQWDIPRVACAAFFDTPHDLTHARTDAQKGDVEENMRKAVLSYFNKLLLGKNLGKKFTKINDVISYLSTCADGGMRLTSMSNYERNTFDFMVAEKYKDKYPRGKLRFASFSYEDLLMMNDSEFIKLQSKRYEHLKFYCPDDQELSRYVEKTHGAKIGLRLIKLFFPGYTSEQIRFIVDGPHGGAWIKFLRWLSQVRNTVTMQGFIDSSPTSSSMLAKATEYYRSKSPKFPVSYLHTPLIAVNGITIRLECDPLRFNSKDTTGIKVIVEKIENDKLIALVYDFTGKLWKQGASVTDVMAACVAAFTETQFTHETPSCHMDMLDFHYYESGNLMKQKPHEKEVVLRKFLNDSLGAALKGSGDPIQAQAAAEIKMNHPETLTIFGTGDILCAALAFLEYELPTVLLIGNSFELLIPRPVSASRTPSNGEEAIKQETQKLADKLFTDSMLCKQSLEWLSVPDMSSTFSTALTDLQGHISANSPPQHIPESKAHIIKSGTDEFSCLTVVRHLCGMELSIINVKAQRILDILRHHNEQLVALHTSTSSETKQLLEDLQKFNEEYDTDPFQEFNPNRVNKLSEFLQKTISAGLSDLDGALKVLFNPKVLKTTDKFIDLVGKTNTFPFWDCNGKNLEILSFDTSLYDSLLTSLISFKRATVVSRSALSFKKKLIDSISSNNYLKEYKMLVSRFGNLGLNTDSLKVFEIPPDLNESNFDNWINHALQFRPPQPPGAAARAAPRVVVSSEEAAAAANFEQDFMREMQPQDLNQPGAGEATRVVPNARNGGAYNKNGRKKRIIMNGGAPSHLQKLETNMLYHRLSYEIYKLLRNVICDNGDNGVKFDTEMPVHAIINRVLQYIHNEANITVLCERLSIIFADFVNDLLKIQMSSDYVYDTTIVDVYTAQLMDVLLSCLFNEPLEPMRYVYPVLLFTPPPPILPQVIKQISLKVLLSMGLVALSSIIKPYNDDYNTDWNPNLIFLSATLHGVVNNTDDEVLEPNNPFETISVINEILSRSNPKPTIPEDSFIRFAQFCIKYYRDILRSPLDVSVLLSNIYTKLTTSSGVLTPDISSGIEQILSPIVGSQLRRPISLVSAARNRVYPNKKSDASQSDASQSDASHSDASQPEPASDLESDSESDLILEIQKVISMIISKFNGIFNESASDKTITEQILKIIKSLHPTGSMGGASSRAKNKITKRNCRNVRRYKKSTPLSKSARKHKYKTINRTAKKNRKNRTHLIRHKSYEKSSTSKQRRTRKIINHQ